MSHEIKKNQITGQHEIAWVNDKPWHGLGQELQEGASIEQWVEAAQMNWEIKDSPVVFNGNKKVPGHKVLYRSDTKDPLAIVTNSFKVVQPKEVVEFFRDLTELYQMKLTVAGCLFGGKRFWATASSGLAANILPDDEVRGELLLMTGCDGKIATTAKFVSTRVVCNNTMVIAEKERGGRMVRTTHHRIFDPKQTKIDLGLISESWDAYLGKLKQLTAVKMTDDAANKFFINLIKTSKDDVETQDFTLRTNRAVEDLMHRLRFGQGADSGRGTAWNVLNAVTEKYTHGTERRDAGRQFADSVYGNDARIKDKAFQQLLAMAA